MTHIFIVNGIIRCCVPEHEQEQILRKCYSEAYGGHHAVDRTAHKVLQSGFYWPALFKDARRFVSYCDECQRIGNIGKRQEMPMNYSLAIEPFDVWGFDFMGHFPSSNGYTHMLDVVDHNTSIKMLKEVIFLRFGLPRYLMTDGVSHFIHGDFRKMLAKYDVNHRIASPYHP
uniref:Integrase zinc-binding domain-containing protein n=1 Tax=Hordeum vulgare subsp. vulgare TaxID=112509 RepID=A0A8I6Y704_HORVV